MTMQNLLPDIQTIAIIGGGPSGLIAAEMLAGMGHHVTIYDGMASLGRKFLLAGRGGLNLTHSEAIEAFVTRYGDAQGWIGAMLDGFSPDDLQVWARGLGQELFVGSSGRVFPKSMKASPLLRACRARLVALDVKVELGAKWQGWSDEEEHPSALVFARSDGTQTHVHADAVLLAMGGGSWSKLGSDGAWVPILVDKGVEVAPLQASNCGVGVTWTPIMVERFAGTPLKAVAITCGDASARGDIVITKSGLEGGAIYALSPALRAGLARGSCQLSVDLRPDIEVRALAQKLVKAKAGKSLSSALKGQGRLSPAAIGLMREACDNKLPTTAMGLAGLIKALPLAATGLSPIDRAISSAGGITQAALGDDLMITALPGVFAAGEMLDWDGPTGGYLLQACFASGKHAAKGVDAYLQAKNKD
jgi:uncharacterized flavoprotein (TIGR03862 family)